MREEHVVEIARPPADVFALLADSARAHEWAEGIVSITVVEEKPGKVGSRYKMVVREAGADNEYDGEVLAWEADRLRRETATRNGQTMTMEQRLDPTPTGTRLTYSAGVDLNGFARLMTPLVRIMLRKSLRKQSAKLKEILERG